MKKMKTEIAGDFLIIFIFCLKYLTKRSKGYVQHLYTLIKYKSITVFIKNKREQTMNNKQ